jgi:hypothetical protein
VDGKDDEGAQPAKSILSPGSPAQDDVRRWTKNDENHLEAVLAQWVKASG